MSSEAVWGRGQRHDDGVGGHDRAIVEADRPASLPRPNGEDQGAAADVEPGGHPLGEGVHPTPHGVPRKAVARRGEAAAPLVDESFGLPAMDQGRKGLGSHGEELCAVVERGHADPTRRQPATWRAALVEHRHLVPRVGQGPAGEQPGQPRSHHDDAHSGRCWRTPAAEASRRHGEGRPGRNETGDR